MMNTFRDGQGNCWIQRAGEVQDHCICFVIVIQLELIQQRLASL